MPVTGVSSDGQVAVEQMLLGSDVRFIEAVREIVFAPIGQIGEVSQKLKCKTYL